LKIKKLRDDIDKIDKQILHLLNERAYLTMNVGRIKGTTGKSVYVPGREREIYVRLQRLNKGPITNKSLRNIYREIMSSSLNLEKPLSVAFLGPELTFTHLAAIERFGSSVSYASCKNITDVFSEVDKELCDYGVVPIENSTEGAVSHTLDMFAVSDLKICAEMYLNVSHNLLAHSADLKSIRYIYSHPMVFGQCRIWLETNVPHAILRDAPSTTEAAAIAAKTKDSACIANLLAKDKYGLKLAAKSIEDSAHNVTRFLVICREMPEPTERDKTSVMFSLKDRAGGLHDILVPFKKNNINLTKIESRPSKMKAWKYYFFVDMDGHVKNEKIRKTLKEVEKGCTYFKVLGSYPVNEM